MQRSFLLVGLVGITLAGCQTGSAPKGGQSPEEIAKMMGLTIYPGATINASETSAEPKAGTTEIRGVLSLTTPDPVKKVAEYYAKEMKAEPQGTDEASSIMAKTPSGQFILMAITRQGTMTQVVARGIVEDK